MRVIEKREGRQTTKMSRKVDEGALIQCVDRVF
jgi:hypothetical protein